MAAGFKILDAYVEVRADASGVGRDAERQIDGQRSTFTRAGGGLGSALMGGMQGVIGGLVGGVTAAFAGPLINGVNQAIGQVMETAKYAIFDYNTLLENAQIGFTTMLGSADKATKMLGDLQAFAAKTPFEFSDLTLASQRLIAMGINAKEVIPTMTAIGDAVAGLGGDKGTIDQITTALGQMTAKGKIQGDELMQLTEAGIPALKILADTYGVTTGQMGDMITKGKVLSDRAVPAIVRGLEKGTATTKGFGGMMEKQSATMSGSLSNIQDAINQTISGAFLPLFKSVERAAGGLSKFAGSKAVKRWADDTAKSMDGFLGSVGKAVKEVFADPKVQKSMENFGIKFTKAFKDAGPELKKILPDLAKFAKDSLPGIIDGATKLAESLPDVVHNLKDLSKQLSSTGDSFGSTASAIGGFLGGILSGLDDLDRNVMGSVKAFWKWRDDVKHLFSGLPDMFATYGSQIVTGFILGFQSKLTDALATVAQFGIDIAKTFTGKMDIQSPSRLFRHYGDMVAKGLHLGLLGGVDDIKSASKKMADSVKDAFDDEKIGKGTRDRMLGQVRSTTKALVAEAKTRETVTDRLVAAKDRLTGLRGDRDSYRSGIRSNVLGAGNIADTYLAGQDAMKDYGDRLADYNKGLAEARRSDAASSRTAASGSLDGRGYQASYTTQGGGTAVADFMRDNEAPGAAPLTGIALIKQKLKKLISNTKKFTVNMKELVKRGIYPDLFQQLMEAGPTAGLEITNELIADKAGFKEINDLGRQLATVGNSLGEFGAGVTYDGQIKSTEKQIGRLRDQRDNITAVMIIEARKIDEVDKVVKAYNALAKTARAKKAVR